VFSERVPNFFLNYRRILLWYAICLLYSQEFFHCLVTISEALLTSEKTVMRNARSTMWLWKL